MANLDMGGATAQVIEHPAVKAKAEEKRAKRAAKDAAQPTETPAIPFETPTSAASAAVAAWVAEQKARAARTKVGKDFGDRVKTANEKLKTALSDNPKAKAATLALALAKAKTKAKELAAEYEEAATEDKGAIGRAYRSRDRVLEERAKAKEAAGEKVEKRSAHLEKVMASIAAQAKQLRLDL